MYGFHRAGYPRGRLCVAGDGPRAPDSPLRSLLVPWHRAAERTGVRTSATPHPTRFVQMSDGLPTPHSISRTGYLVHVRCKACRHAKGTDLAALVDAGAGDMPWVQMNGAATTAVRS